MRVRSKKIFFNGNESILQNLNRVYTICFTINDLELWKQLYFQCATIVNLRTWFIFYYHIIQWNYLSVFSLQCITSSRRTMRVLCKQKMSCPIFKPRLLNMFITNKQTENNLHGVTRLVPTGLNRSTNCVVIDED